jgi:hypothetical protein
MALDDRPRVHLISHSPVIYWWPAIIAAFAIGIFTYLYGSPLPGDPDGARYYPSNNPGLFFIFVITLLVVFTNAKLRGVYSLLTISTIAFFVVLFAWLGWWDEIWRLIPQLSAKANAGFYLVFGTILLIVWLSAFFVFDRTTYWTVYPGQIVEQRIVGGASNSHDTDTLVFEKKDRDLFRHTILGLGAGDVRMTTPGRDPIDIPNVLLIENKIRRAQELISVKPDQPEEHLVMPEMKTEAEKP